MVRIRKHLIALSVSVRGGTEEMAPADFLRRMMAEHHHQRPLAAVAANDKKNKNK